ncbi:hypothetical protein L7F22_058308 [Adiantum nelumboides]|nr:hypothetical protein [Adiantum nelumboides]
MSRLHQRVLLSWMEHNSVSSSGSNHNSRLPLAFAGSGGGSKPGLSFPLGTGLVVLIILFVSALFSFCYHWLTINKIRRAAITPSSTGSDAAQEAVSSATPNEDGKPLPTMTKLDMVQCPPVVYMAGEYIPRFIAVPCPFSGASPLSIRAAEDDIAAAHKKALSFEALKLDIRH